MFWQEDDVQPAVNSATKLFGKQNQYHHGINTLKNVTIYTAEYGKLWFGDVCLGEAMEGGFKDKLRLLSKLINQRVCYNIGSGNFDFTDSVCESNVISGT